MENIILLKELVNNLLVPAAIFKFYKEDNENKLRFILEHINTAAAVDRGLKDIQVENIDLKKLFPQEKYHKLYTFLNEIIEEKKDEKSKQYPPLSVEEIIIKLKIIDDYFFINWTDKTSSFEAENIVLKKNIDNLATALSKMEELKEFYKVLGEAVPYGSWMADAEGKLSFLSPSFLKLLNISFNEINLDDWPSILDKENAVQVAKTWKDAVKNKKPFNADFEIYDEFGECHFVLSTAHPVKNENDEISYWVGYHLKNDVRKLEENKVKKLVKELEQSNEALKQFAYIASHDLQEPLRMVTSFTQLLEKRYKDKLDNDAREFIHYAVDGAERMKKLIDSLLSYSRILSAEEILKPVNVKKVLTNIISDLQMLIEENHAVIKYDNDLPVLESEENLFTHVLQNLITNAIIYKSEVPPIINVTAETKENYWLFCVEDNGIGIDERYFDQIFKLFKRLQSRDKHPGVGIGLAVCKRVIERFGGNIWLESEKGKGTKFYFTIPKKKVENEKQYSSS